MSAFVITNNKPFSPLLKTCCITKWFDQLLADLLNTYPGEICPNPITIEAQTVSSQPASQTGNIFQVYNPTSGFACVNANQVGVLCVDYKVRFTCPEERCSTGHLLLECCITQWFDHDDPDDENGDSELLADLLNIYPGQICPNPIDIDVEPVSGFFFFFFFFFHAVVCQ
uniref:Si:dkey-205h13.2 n=1 Tax=Sinocyclocheilus grahami TaxID=75366 RepID=A0A672SWX9_SINGR